VGKAEKALEDAKPQIEAHVKGEVTRLQGGDGQGPIEPGRGVRRRDELFHVGFELKGRGTSAGYSMVTALRRFFCAGYTEAVKQPAAKELAIMKAHVDSIAAIVGRGIHGDQNADRALAIAAELEKVVGRRRSAHHPAEKNCGLACARGPRVA